MSHKTALRYIEQKTLGKGASLNDKGPAWIARVVMSRSGRSLYFGGRMLLKANVPYGNYIDAESNAYWVSGVKKNGEDRHWAGSGKISIESSAVDEYLEIIGASKLEGSKFTIIPDFPPPDIAKFHDLKNR